MCGSCLQVLQHSHVDAPPMVTLSHVAPFAAAALVVPMSYFESSHAVHTYADWRPALPMVLLSGVLAACLNFVVSKLRCSQFCQHLHNIRMLCFDLVSAGPPYGYNSRTANTSGQG
jgi:hypothetical protein